jgi:hypothetical protein
MEIVAGFAIAVLGFALLISVVFLIVYVSVRWLN